MPVIVKGLRRAFDMVEKVLKIFFTVCKSELLDIAYSSHRIEETASAVPKMDIMEQFLRKKSKIHCLRS